MKKLNLKPLIWVSLIIIILWLLTPLVVYNLFENPDDIGTFGEMYGGLNTLFSGLAFAGVIYTILLQKSELELQRKELVETRRELKRSADAQEKSEVAFTKQLKIMNKTATINGLSTIVDYYKGKANSQQFQVSKKNDYNTKAAEFSNKIINILNEIEEEEKTN